MAAADPSTASDPAPAETAARLKAASFVRVVGRATGAGLAATGQLARGLAAVAVPFQAGVGPLGADGPGPTGPPADLTVTVGRPGVPADIGIGEGPHPSAVAYDVSAALEPCEPAPILALAGLVADDGATPEDRPDIVEAAGVERRPGLGLPVADPAAGLAYTTLAHTDLSGDPAAVSERFDSAEAEAPDGSVSPEERASIVALSVAATTDPAEAGRAIEAVLRPHDGGLFETVAGYADVLRALAARAPGLGLEIALESGTGRSGTGDRRERALAHWRAFGKQVHARVADAETVRYDGVVLAETDDGDPTWAVARLLRDYVSPEPVVVLLGDAEALATTRGDGSAFATAVETAAETEAGRVVTTQHRARAVTDEPESFADSVREAI